MGPHMCSIRCTPPSGHIRTCVSVLGCNPVPACGVNPALALRVGTALRYRTVQRQLISWYSLGHLRSYCMTLLLFAHFVPNSTLGTLKCNVFMATSTFLVDLHSHSPLV